MATTPFGEVINSICKSKSIIFLLGSSMVVHSIDLATTAAKAEEINNIKKTSLSEIINDKQESIINITDDLKSILKYDLSEIDQNDVLKTIRRIALKSLRTNIPNGESPTLVCDRRTRNDARFAIACSTLIKATSNLSEAEKSIKSLVTTTDSLPLLRRKISKSLEKIYGTKNSDETIHVNALEMLKDSVSKKEEALNLIRNIFSNYENENGEIDSSKVAQSFTDAEVSQIEEKAIKALMMFKESEDLILTLFIEKEIKKDPGSKNTFETLMKKRISLDSTLSSLYSAISKDTVDIDEVFSIIKENTNFSSSNNTRINYFKA